ncbi:hypothetical protein [Bradyrhizobium symbiodeficiens]|uniref:Uncharacterized protein n=1 Tax=Bradyrhizobium symbiodeficiens TaxID=1404367 RepID=A0A6G9ABZ2_9BRAD|nr:hypothetical protein [Bradyrhizobium symbiodeficiens]QIP09815.1 hypothetical protein HAV00_27820 [Bradyrhizobium symbiodeficiens]
MSRSSSRTPAGRWLPGNIRIMGVKLVAVTKSFRGFVEQFGIRYGQSNEKLRGPVLWLGDLRKRNDVGQGPDADPAVSDPPSEKQRSHAR